MNVVIISGRLGKEAEIKASKQGKEYCNFSLAVQDAIDYKKTIWVDCTAFGKTAVLLCEYTQKGDMLTVSGALSVSEYEKEGQKIKKYSVLVNKFDFPARAKGDMEQVKEFFEGKKDDEEDDFPF